jgi:hypothetical protein
MHYDIYNGDADGICALLQLRLNQPLESTLVTGVKRDINLMSKVTANAGDRLTVLDVSLDKNRDALNNALTAGAQVFYVDHHFAGDIPEHDNLQHIINPAANVCTSLLINNHLVKTTGNNPYLAWAVVGTYGDNLFDSAKAIAKPLNLTDKQLTQLQDLGIYINYNGYGASVNDLHFAPDELFKLLLNYPSPFDFINDQDGAFTKLEQGYQQDMQSAAKSPTIYESEAVAIIELPDEAWSRRVSGVYGNELAINHPDRAHAVLTSKANGTYLVSVRAPMNNKTGADEFCRSFATGGGRAAAAGINELPKDQLDSFTERFNAFYG